MEKKINFRNLGISDRVLNAIEAKWYKTPSAIQAWVIPLLLKWNKDIIGQAQTWTWKTASFAIPLIERLDNKKREVQAIILTPTRELAIQVAKEIESFWWGFKITLLYGGRNIRDDIRELKNGSQIIVWTPGRVQDHLNKKRLDLSKINYFILDEADEMLNIWFKEEIEEIMSHAPKNKKVLLFSATMPRAILNIAKKYMWEYDTVSIKSDKLTWEGIEQKYYEIAPRNKFEALCRVIDVTQDFYGIVFCKTKMDVDDVAARLIGKWITAEWIHWDIEQKGREKILSRFKAWKIKILVATDVAARWIDVENLTHVVNYAMPDNPEVYTHRIGRTWRAGKKWIAISFVTRMEKRKIFAIERETKAKLKREDLPKALDILNIKKKRLLEEIAELIKEANFEDFIDLSKDIAGLGTKEVVLSALLKKFYWKTLGKDAYRDIKQSSFGNRDNSYCWRNSYSSRWSSYTDSNEIRLFIARWRKDSLAPWSLIQFIEKEVGMNIWQVWKINILENFSYMNVEKEKWEIILQYFKKENSIKPLIVRAKEKKWWWSFWWRRSFWGSKEWSFRRDRGWSSGWKFKRNNTWFRGR